MSTGQDLLMPILFFVRVRRLIFEPELDTNGRCIWGRLAGHVLEGLECKKPGQLRYALQMGTHIQAVMQE